MKRNIFKTITSIILICIMSVNGLTFYTSAEGISPRYANISDYDVNFYIPSGGMSQTVINYTAIGTFTQAKISIEVQKKTMLFFWTTVDIGMSDNVWRTTSTNPTGFVTYRLQLSETGTYRAIVTIEFMGSSGVTDTIEKTIEAKYN